MVVARALYRPLTYIDIELATPSINFGLTSSVTSDLDSRSEPLGSEVGRNVSIFYEKVAMKNKFYLKAEITSDKPRIMNLG